ncbi:MAG TPA: zinc ABC transporter substrate-binding protein, partial [Euzebyales bacterium]|nr:zinc ABC transporter substrate-binding protein [Euzebyales bacterium]
MSRHTRNAARRSPRTALPVILCVATLVLAACGTDAGPLDQTSGAASGEADRLSIVATTTILADVTANIAGDAAEVTAVMEVGADPHNFEASARQLAEMQQADLIVANGANLEEHLLGPLADAERAGVPVFHATDHIAPLRLAGGSAHASEVHDAEADRESEAHSENETHGQSEAHSEDEATHDESTEAGLADHATSEAGHTHEEGSVDPHFWMDPLRMADVAR